MSRPRQPRLAVLAGLGLLLGVALLCAYGPAFQAGFVYDDSRLITHNPFLQGPLDWTALFVDKHSVAPDAEPDIYRPLSTLSFFVENRLGKGSAVVHHAAGLGFHLLNTLLFFYFLLKLLAPAGEPSGALWIPLAGAALFALHPVQVESVVWISSRSGQISAFFILLALIVAIGPNRQVPAPRGVAATVLFVGVATFLACLGRESGVMTGVFIFLCAFCIKGLRKKTIVACGIASLGAALVYLAWRYHVMDGAIHQVAPHGGGWFKNFLYGAYGCLYQAGLLLRPWFHNLDYQDGFFDGLPMWEVAAGGCVYFLLVAFAILSIRRHPLAACGILLFAAAQFPTSSLVITVRSLVNDRYLYLPLMGACVSVCAALGAIDRRSPAMRKGAAALTVALILILSLLTHDRSRDWVDSKSLWTAALKTHPASIRAHVALSKAALQEDDAGGALKIAVAGYKIGRFGTAVRMNAMYKAAQALAALGRAGEYRSLLRELLAEASHPEGSENFRLFERAALELFEFEVRAGRFDDAARIMENLIVEKGPSAINLHRLGVVLEHAGRPEEAADAIRRSAEMKEKEERKEETIQLEQ